MRMSVAMLLAVSLLLLASYPTTTDAQCIQVGHFLSGV